MSTSICHGCSGMGKYDTIGIEVCYKCVGTGRDTKSDLWAEPCMRCNGSGKMTYARKEVCKICRGSGSIHSY